MKKLLTLLTLCTCSLSAFAYDVEVDGIYYNLIKKAKTAEVTYKEEDYWSCESYSGNVTIPETITCEDVEYKVTSIGFAAFSFHSSLTSVIIPNTVTEISHSAFWNCYGLTSISIPNSVTSILNSTFNGCSNLITATIPNSVTSIGDYAFCGCSSLTSITIPNSVTSIGNNAFEGCSGLTSVSFGNTVTSIGEHAFDGCVSLSSAVIPNSVTSMGECVFWGCSGLTSVTLSNSLTSISGGLFHGCGLTSVTIPNCVSSIGSSAFYGCSGLSSVTIPNSVKIIGHSTFYGCSGLTSVTIGNGATNIDFYAFANCKNLEDVNCLADAVPNTEFNTFEDSYIEYCTLHVPAESMDAYKAATPWSEFGTITTFEGNPGVETPTCATPTIALLNGKLVVKSETPGAEYHLNVMYESATSDLNSNNSTFNLPICQIIVSAYATAEGYLTSETTTASFDFKSTQTASGDLNGDGAITISDVTQLVNAVLEESGGVP